MRKKLVVLLSAIFVLFAGNLYSAEKPIKLVFTHWEPASGVGGSTVIEFCKELEAKTNGRVKAEPALACTLGPAAEQFELVASGMADIGGFMPFNTPGRFPLLAVMSELPHVAAQTAPISKMYNEMTKKGYFDKEVNPNKLLWVSCVSPLQIQSQDKMTSLADLNRKKIRTSGEFWLTLAPKLGVAPVSVTISDMYSSLDKRVIDGAFLAYSAMDVFKIKEVVKHVLEVNLTYSTFAYAMNQKVYDGLPADIRKIIDELAEKYGKIEGEKHDSWHKSGKASFLAMSGREVHTLSADDWGKLKSMCKSIGEEWIAKREAKGIPARKLVDDMKATLEKSGVREEIW